MPTLDHPLRAQDRSVAKPSASDVIDCPACPGDGRNCLVCRGKGKVRLPKPIPVEITIAGPSGSGKTAIAYIVTKALREAGVKVSPRGDQPNPWHRDGRALEAAKAQGTRVVIQERVIARKPR